MQRQAGIGGGAEGGALLAAHRGEGEQRVVREGGEPRGVAEVTGRHGCEGSDRQGREAAADQ